MRWLTRKTRQDIWDEAIEAPLGDIEAAERIRAICDAAASSAVGSARNDKRDGSNSWKHGFSFRRSHPDVAEPRGAAPPPSTTLSSK